jgi:hypothetical protein
MTEVDSVFTFPVPQGSQEQVEAPVKKIFPSSSKSGPAKNL